LGGDYLARQVGFEESENYVYYELGAHDHKVHLANFLLRLGFALFGVALLRDGYAGLRGRELWLQGKGFNWVFLRGRTGRFAGAFFILAGVVFLTVAWFGL